MCGHDVSGSEVGGGRRNGVATPSRFPTVEQRGKGGRAQKRERQTYIKQSSWTMLTVFDSLFLAIYTNTFEPACKVVNESRT